MTIDFHTHAFPDHLAQRAMKILIEASGNIPAYTDGTIGGTENKMRACGVDKFVVLNIATNAKQQTNVNNFAINNNGKNCIMFGSVYPFAPDALSELDRIKAAGLKGVKMHSEYQDFFADDERVFPIYDKIRELGLILVFHGGTDIGYLNSPVKCSPQAVRKVADNFKGLKLVTAHLGGFRETESTLKLLCGRDIYLDTSVADVFFTRENAEKLINAHGEDYLIFGSDCPWGDPGKAIKFIDSLKIASSKKEAIFYKNAEFLLNIQDKTVDENS
jgi:predicted TIM-barrel fold metal-dependent hydrolase